ncbi:hypothetical protein QTP88_010778 [Uroleucon formosanum]
MSIIVVYRFVIHYRRSVAVVVLYSYNYRSLRYVLRERGKREFAADANKFALAAFAASNRVLPICGERDFAADNIPIFFVF